MTADRDLDDAVLDDMAGLARLGRGASAGATRDLIDEVRRLRARMLAQDAVLDELRGEVAKLSVADHGTGVLSIDTDAMRSAYRGMPGGIAVARLCDEVDRLRVEADIASVNAKMNAALDELRGEVAKLREAATAAVEALKWADKDDQAADEALLALLTVTEGSTRG